MKKAILIALILVFAGVTANAQNKQETPKVSHLTYKEFQEQIRKRLAVDWLRNDRCRKGIVKE